MSSVLLGIFLKSAAARRSTFCINSVIIRCEFGKLLGFGALLLLTPAGWEFLPFPKHRPNHRLYPSLTPCRLCASSYMRVAHARSSLRRSRAFAALSTSHRVCVGRSPHSLSRRRIASTVATMYSSLTSLRGSHMCHGAVSNPSAAYSLRACALPVSTRR